MLTIMERGIPLLRRLLMRRRTRNSLLIALAIVVALGVAAVLRKTAPPEIARLLPESDAIFYVDIKPIRTATHFDRQWANNPTDRSPEYQRFLDATGIVPERDLDAAAIALHRIPGQPDKSGATPSDLFVSEVFTGRFDGQRLTQYLTAVATASESYAGRTIYSIPLDGQTLRIAQLGYDTIAASNMPTTEQIHSILDRYSASASPFSGSSLLNARYREVPLLSSAWAIGRIGLPLSQNGKVQAFGISLPLPSDTTFVASLRFVGTIHLRIEEITRSDADAEKSASSLGMILTLFKSFADSQLSAPSLAANTDLRKFVDSLAVKQDKDHVLITGSVSLDALRSAASSAGK